MPDQYTLAGFGQRIKAKYPQYANVPDEELARKVLAKYPQYQSAILPAPRSINPEARTVGNYASEVARGVGRGIVDDVSGLYQSLRHPIKTATSIADQAGAAGNAAMTEFRQTQAAPMGQRLAAGALTFLENAPLVGGMVQKAEEGGTRMASPEAAGAAAEGITAFGFPDLAARTVKGLAPRAVETVRGTLKRGAGISPLDIRDAAQKVVEENRAATEKAKSANEKSAAKHLEDTRSALEKQKEARRKIIQKNREGAAAHKTAADEVKAHNQRILDERKARSEATRKLDESSQELRARIETAREKALKVGNQKYSTVNEKLNPIGADMETIMGGLGDAMDKIKGSDTEPAILKDIDKKIGEGEALTYKDLQGYYSELNRELSKGTLPGDVYAAYDTLHDAIGKEMQRIADSQGAGQQLVEARNYWRRMKQTFGKPFTPGDVATQTLKVVTPDFVKNEEMANRLRLLGSFDPRIPQLAENVENLQQGLHSLGKEKPLRESVKQNPAPFTPDRVPKMQDADVPNIPPEVLAQHKGLTPDDIRRDQIARIEEVARKTRHGGPVDFASRGISTWSLAEALRGEWHYAAALAAARIILKIPRNALGSLLERPNVQQWLADPTRDEISVYRRLSPEQQAVFGQSIARLTQAAKSARMKVSPFWSGIAALATAASQAPAPRAQHPTDAWQGVNQ